MINLRPITLHVCIICLLSLPLKSAAVSVIDEEASPLELSISGVYMDDINPTLDESIGAYGAIFAPQGKLVTSLEGAQFMLDYGAELARYKLDDDTPLIDTNQDFDTFRVKLLSRFFIGQAWHIDAQLQHLNQTQRFGEGISQLRQNVFEADHLKQNRGDLTLVYGNDITSRYISVSAFSSKTTYDPTNDYSSFFDIKEQGVEFDIAFKQSEVSSLLFRVAATDEDFVSDEREDSQVYQGLLGVKWQPSGKTELEALIGMYSREFDSQDTSSGLSWALDFSTEPTENWLLEIKSARFSGVSKSEITSSSVEQNASLSMTYKASERWQFGVSFLAGNTQFDGIEASSELDERRAQANISLMLKKHSKILFSLGINDQSFDDSFIDYQQSEARLTWQVYL